MAEIANPSKALSVNPLKASQPVGASLAFLGLARSMPLEHGARGCTSFNKLFFMRHFHEPIALQTTAMDHTTTVLGADDSVVEALMTVCNKTSPAVIGLITTGLSETQGADIPRTIDVFRKAHPEFADVGVVPVNATDTLGCLETGFALAVEAMINTLVPSTPQGPRRARQVNVLASAMLTPGDIDEIRDWIEAFDLDPVILPDVGNSLGGHLIDEGYSPLTYGGTTATEIRSMPQSAATLVIGASLDRAANALYAKTSIPDYRFDGLMTLTECDAFTTTLAKIAAHPASPRIERRRAQLADAMVDCQFQFGGARIAIAADAGQLAMLTRFFTGMGSKVVAAVASARAAVLEDLPLENVIIGDLEDFEWLAREHGAEMIVTNSHGAEIAKRLGTEHLRAGFPVYDAYGAHAEAWVGYGGARATLFRAANLLASHYQELRPYRSRYWQGTARELEATKGNIEC